MPIYKLKCKRCDKEEEKLFTSYVNFITPKERRKKRKQEEVGEEYYETTKKFLGFKVIEKRPAIQHKPRCSFCGGDQELLPSLPSMQPDPYWSGQIKHGKYVTKKSQIPPQIEPATRENVEHVEKRKAQRYKDHEEKSSNNLKKFLREQLADVEVGPGATDA
jgi:hypothetical protein